MIVLILYQIKKIQVLSSEDSKEPMFEKFKNLLKLLKPDAAS